jgi:ribosomal protein S15P/S13E
MDISIDMLLEAIESSELTPEQVSFLTKNIKHINAEFIKRYKKDIIINV